VCRSEKLYSIDKGKRRRCARCRYSFSPFVGRWLNKVKISPQDWLWIVKLFALEMSAATVVKEVGISYPTVLKAFDTIRSAIAEPTGSDSAKGPESMQRASVFGISRSEGNGTSLEELPDNLVLIKLDLNHGRVILTRREIEYRSLSWMGSSLEIADLGKHPPHCRVYSSERGFWLFAKEHLTKYHGVSFAKLPLYIREIDFRWMHRDEKLFDTMIERLCDFTPVSNSADTKPMAESAWIASP
jgi:transposase